MFYWICFFIVTLNLAYLIEKRKNTEKSYNCFVTILFFILVYFSAFRDGLGQDYASYMLIFESHSNRDVVSNILSVIVSNTILSSVFAFLVYSIVTQYFFLKTMLRYKEFFIIFMAYVSGLYSMGFNEVRQTAAVAIFVYSIEYIETKRIYKFLFFIFLASLFHKSALILFPIYFIGYVRKKYIFCLMFFVILFIPFFYSKQAITFLDFLNFSTDYVENSYTTGISVGLYNFTYIPIFLFITYVFFRSKNDSFQHIYILSFLFFVSFLFSMFIPYFYRITRYFCLYFYISYTLLFLLPFRRCIYALFVVLFASLMINTAFSSNRLVVPTRILSPFTLFEDEYYVYEKEYYNNLVHD